MNVGNRLKNIRIFLGLTQEEFSAGIVTESFYSRVENGESFISVTDLIAILNYHHFSVTDFFAPDDIKHKKRLLMQAFIDRDLGRIKKLEKSMNLTSSKDKIISRLMFIILTNHVNDVPEEFKEEARKHLLEIGKIDNETLFQLLLLIPIIDQEWIKLVLDYSVKDCDFTKIDNFSLRLVSHVLIAFLEQCYQEDNKTDAKNILHIFGKIPPHKSLFLERILVDCYRAWIQGDEERLKSTIVWLRKNGYGRYIINFSEQSMKNEE